MLRGSQPHMSCTTQQQLRGHSSPVYCNIDLKGDRVQCYKAVNHTWAAEPNSNSAGTPAQSTVALVLQMIWRKFLLLDYAIKLRRFLANIDIKEEKKYNFTVKEKKITVSNIDMDKSTQFKKIVKDLMQCYTFLLMIIKPAVPKKNHILFRLSGHFPIFVHLICITRWGDLLDV